MRLRSAVLDEENGLFGHSIRPFSMPAVNAMSWQSMPSGFRILVFCLKKVKKKANDMAGSNIFRNFATKRKIMALNTDKNLKLYYSIKEVAEMLNVSESMLRFWEKEIPAIKPKTTGNNIRQYTEKDIENIKVVYNLVKVRGFKLAAARKMLRENKEGVDKNARIMENLISVRDELKKLKKQLDYLT